MTESNRAVFLSYAREDAAAARRIATALSAAGAEVWLDESELRGGDAWDTNIRRQIHECALFVPIISAQTQSRKEGYFRREWKQAVDRLDDIAEGIPFLVPVCIDETKEKAALVPAAFLRVQWTRIRPDDAPEAFVQRVQQLLGHSDDRGRRTDDGGRTTQDVRQRAERGGLGPELARTGRKGGAKWLLAAAAALMIGGGAYFALRPAKKEAAPTPVTSRPTAAQPPTEFAPANSAAKSIAVLPFANLSDDKDASAFFSDGIHEDILTNLSNIRELRVVSRTSVMSYRGTTKRMAEIAKELGVAFILEGSVRRAGNKVRVTGQLIRAATDEHLWAKNYDRDLTDIFAIQSELSQAIAGELRAAISPEEKKLLEQRPTQNIAAYELVLKARELRARSIFSTDAQEQLLRSALQLDPNYAIAHAELGYVHAINYYYGRGPANNLSKSREAIDRAMQIAPDSPDVIRGLGDYYYYGESDFARALVEYQRVARLRPNDAQTYNRMGSVQRRLGRWKESLASFRKAEELDPTSLDYVAVIRNHLMGGRRFAEAIAQQRRLIELDVRLGARFDLAYLHYTANGSTQEMEAFLGGLSPAQAASPEGIALRRRWALGRGDLEEVGRADNGTDANSYEAIVMASGLAALGQREAAIARVSKWVEEVRTRSLSDRGTGPGRWRAMVEAVLGNKEEALQWARKTLQAVESRDPIDTASCRVTLALVHTLNGDKEAAITEFAGTLQLVYGGSSRLNTNDPPDINIHVMKHDPRFAPLRDDPRFQALLNDPNNNAPLF